MASYAYLLSKIEKRKKNLHLIPLHRSWWSSSRTKRSTMKKVVSNNNRFNFLIVTGFSRVFHIPSLLHGEKILWFIVSPKNRFRLHIWIEIRKKIYELFEISRAEVGHILSFEKLGLLFLQKNEFKTIFSVLTLLKQTLLIGIFKFFFIFLKKIR